MIPALVPSRCHAPTLVLCRNYRRITAERLSLFLSRLIYRSLALGLSRSRSCLFILGLSHSVISYRCAHGLMPSGSLDIVILSSRALMLSCCRTLILAYDHDIMLAWHHAPMISCSHNRGVIMILHFPSPTPSCPHAPSLLQSLTCKETLPHCLASRSLIVQVSKIVLPPL